MRMGLSMPDREQPFTQRRQVGADLGAGRGEDIGFTQCSHGFR